MTHRYSSRFAEPAGYTLVELIVSIGIFFLVATVAAGAYVALIGLDRQTRAQSDLFTSLSFALESMARDIRVGSAYACLPGDAAGNSTDGSCHQFRYASTALGTTVTYRVNGNGTIGKCTGSAPCTDSTATSLTDPRIMVPADGLTFYVRNADAASGQPTVTMTLAGSAEGASGIPLTFSVQTTATQRLNE